MLHTTLVWSIVPSFCLLNRNFPPRKPSALSIFNYRSGCQTFSVIPHFEQGGLLVGQAPYLHCPRGHRIKSVLLCSQSSPHLFSASLPVITSCTIQIKALLLYIYFFKVA